MDLRTNIETVSNIARLWNLQLLDVDFETANISEKILYGTEGDLSFGYTTSLGKIIIHLLYRVEAKRVYDIHIVLYDDQIYRFPRIVQKINVLEQLIYHNTTEVAAYLLNIDYAKDLWNQVLAEASNALA